MSMSGDSLGTLRRLAAGQGWTWVAGKPIPYGEQFRVHGNGHEVTVSYYPKRGRIVLGGAESPVLAALRGAMGGAKPVASPLKTASKGAPAIPDYPHIGMDESGKGDWFGPLVVAAVCLDKETAPLLAAKQVRDSKTVGAAALPGLAAEIKSVVLPTHRIVRVLLPEEYNRRYAESGNLNRLLADVYAEVAAEAVGAVGGTMPVVCDQFAQSKDVLSGTFLKRGLPSPVQQHGAEAASLAVAAASILATSAFGEAMLELGNQAELGGALPRGSSDIRRLEQAVRNILAKEGKAGLHRYAKTHFRPVMELLSMAG